MERRKWVIAEQVYADEFEQAVQILVIGLTKMGENEELNVHLIQYYLQGKQHDKICALAEKSDVGFAVFLARIEGLEKLEAKNLLSCRIFLN